MSTRREIEAVYPLSPQQQGMLLRSLQDDRNALFVEQEVHTLHGPIDVNAFKGAWQDLLDRHHMLRTAFSWRTRSEPLQVVFRGVPVPLDVHDWRLQTPVDRKRQLDEYLRRERLRGFDFSRPPLMRLALIRTTEHTHELVWTQHHILYDGWCRAVLFRELTAFFVARSSGATAALPEAAQYGSYVEWLKRQDPSDARHFWRRQLEGVQDARPLGRTTGSSPSPRSGVSGHHEAGNTLLGRGHDRPRPICAAEPSDGRRSDAGALGRAALPICGPSGHRDGSDGLGAPSGSTRSRNDYRSIHEHVARARSCRKIRSTSARS